MKKVVFCSMLLILSAASSGQSITPAQPLTSEDHLKKSKTQKTVGWIMLGGGVAMTTIGLVTTDKQANDDPLYLISDKASGLAILMLAGIGTALGSIPFFIAAGKNRRKAAASVSFKMENATNIYQWAVTNTRYPAVAIQIRL